MTKNIVLIITTDYVNITHILIDKCDSSHPVIKWVCEWKRITIQPSFYHQFYWPFFFLVFRSNSYAYTNLDNRMLQTCFHFILISRWKISILDLVKNFISSIQQPWRNLIFFLNVECRSLSLSWKAIGQNLFIYLNYWLCVTIHNY